MDEMPFGYVLNKQGQDSHAIASWNHLEDKPADIARKPDIAAAINGLAKFDPNKVFTKDEVNAAIVKAIGDLQDKIYGGDVNAALDTIKELQDAYNGSNTIIQKLLTQLANKANVGDSYPKKDADARFAAKSDLDNLSVGGRNYALNTANLSVGSTITFSQPLSSFAGQMVTLSVRVDVDSAQPMTGGNNRIGAEFTYTNHLGQTVYFGVWKNLAVGESFHGRVSQTTQLDSTVTADGAEQQLYIQTSSANAKVSLFKLELGNHQTDWSPAPEDMAKQIDLSLVEKYGLPRNYWIVKNQTNGYSMDSAGNPTVENATSVVSDYMPMDRAGQFELIGWNGLGKSLLAVYYYDDNKKFLTATMWTTTAVAPATTIRETAVEIWKYGPSNASYIRVESHLGLSAKLAIWSEVFRENSDYVPALEDLNGSGTLSETVLEQKLSAYAKSSDVYAKTDADAKFSKYPLRYVYDLKAQNLCVSPAGTAWTVYSATLETTQYSEYGGSLDLNMVVSSADAQPVWHTWYGMFRIQVKTPFNLSPSGGSLDSNNGFACLTNSGIPFSTFVSDNTWGEISIGFKTYGQPISAGDWRVINMHINLGRME